MAQHEHNMATLEQNRIKEKAGRDMQANASILVSEQQKGFERQNMQYQAKMFGYCFAMTATITGILCWYLKWMEIL